MNRIALSIVAVCLTPLLSGCCCCGSSMQCGSYGGYNSYGSDYGGCLTYEDSYAGGGKKCHCKGGDDFSLPPEGSSYPMQSGMPYGTTYGPEIVGPEVYGPEYVPNDAQWQTVAPGVPGSTSPVTPAVPGAATSGPTPLLPPSPIPQISNGSSVVVPPPAPPYSPASSTGETTGPMMPPVPPPPPEPISQMRFRQYR